MQDAIKVRVSEDARDKLSAQVDGCGHRERISFGKVMTMTSIVNR